MTAAVRAKAADGNLPAPATPQDVTAVEAVVGYPMPHLLRRLDLELANGGFDPWNIASVS
ncbi:hypothetical protein [Streptomyces melanogenes]|uniref:hypothetical protein n=1 Tax=Streptomyces melanogenes TaxID=67326 RepID=UPI0037A39D6F